MPIKDDLLINAAEKHWQHFYTQATIAIDERLKARLDQNSTLIKRAFALSDFIAHIATQYPIEFLLLLAELHEQKAHSFTHFGADLEKNLANVETELELHQALRKFRHLSMLAIAWRDLLYKADIKESMTAVSELADVLIHQANEWLYQKACERYGKPALYKGEDQRLLVIGMGKLGGRELNFSSDIDLIFVYPELGETRRERKPIEHQTFFIKLAQKLIAALHQTTVDGQAYRVDMRLRPLGDSGPLVVSIAAFESYYTEQGREWERFAMQKARIIAPTEHCNSAAICDLKSIIRPFVYRKYLDFTTIESLRKMKQLIMSEVARRNLTNNIKLGKGGIREVEFFMQTLQMIHAGKVTECQSQSILTTFKNLEEHEFLDKPSSQSLRSSYLFLRQIEHYLQQFDDKQTQTLPNDDINQHRLTSLLNLESYTDVLKKIESEMTNINSHFAELIEAPENVSDAAEATTNTGNNEPHNAETKLDSIDKKRCTGEYHDFHDLWNLDLEQSEMERIFESMFAAQSAISSEEQAGNTIATELSANLLTFKQNSTKHNVGERGHRSLAKLVPTLLQEICQSEDLNYRQVVELTRSILDILQTMLGRTAYLDLLLENPQVRARLLHLSHESTWVAKQIKAFPLLLDELLHPAYLQQDKGDYGQWFREYEDELRLQLLRIEPDDVEAQMDALRYFKLTQQLRIAAADISGSLPVSKVSDKLSVLAEVILHNVINMGWQQITERFGTLEGAESIADGLGVIAYGKLGGIELGYGSDLDIVFVHDVDLSSNTQGKKSISCSEFFVKLVQRISHLFTTKTYLGQLYEIDLRLRPSGNSGLLISHIDTFANYQQKEAWTWEHQALVRARMVFGSASLAERFSTIRRSILSTSRDSKTLNEDVAQMREKMRKHLDKSDESNLDLKQTRGGITDLEFLTQYWVLANSHDFPQLTTWTDNLRILSALATTDVLSETESERLQHAYLTIRNTLHRQSLNDGASIKGYKWLLPENVKDAQVLITEAFTTVFNGVKSD